MQAETRRDKILQYLSRQDKPVSGTALAKEFGVSRQIIVQDIALLRSSHVDIISTNRGYVIQEEHAGDCIRVFKCRHSDEEVEAELNAIVDQGGFVENVFVNHKVYGRIQAEMNIRCRRDVKAYVDRIHSGKSRLLKNVTSDYHYHTVLAESEEVLDAIEQELKDHGILVPKKEQ
ncbi:MAG: transcription repressor NadR [Eubacterium sp.]|nr:transcription repressor NadR [Eubacterium sp.]